MLNVLINILIFTISFSKGEKLIRDGGIFNYTKDFTDFM